MGETAFALKSGKTGWDASSIPLLAVQPWARSLTSLSLGFLSYWGVRLPAPTADGCRDKVPLASVRHLCCSIYSTGFPSPAIHTPFAT